LIDSNRRIRFALVGCGRISTRHLDAIAAHHQDAELVAVCDPHAERRKSVAAQYEVPEFQDLEALLASAAAPDVAILASPSGIHAKQAATCAEANVHVITEKPMATRWADGLRMVETFDRRKCRLFVVKQNRRNATLQLVRRAVAEQRFGRIYAVNVNVFWTRPQSYYDMDAWRGTWEFDGGALMNQASHYVDLLDWLVGPVQSVHAFTATLARRIEVEDSAVLNLRWRNGALGSMNVSMLTYPENLEGSLTILGEHGTVKVGGVAVNRIDHWQFADSHPDDNTVASANYEPTSVYGFGHPAYYENVIDTLRGRAEAETDGREGLRSLELLIAAYISARDHRVVSLPLEY